MNTLINGINMAWDDIGSGPALLLIHGFPLNRCMWRPQIAAMTAAGYRVVAPDLRGFGESDSSDGQYTIDLFADDIVCLLDHLGIERAVVGGMSMGGYILLNMLERYRERITAACFIVTRSGADDESGRERRLNLARDTKEHGPRVVADFFVKMLFAEETAREKPELVTEVSDWMTQSDPGGLAGGLLAMRDRKDYTPLLSGFSLPTLIIGAEQDKAVSAEHLHILASGLPQSKKCLIQEAGHLVNMEQPAAFNNCLLDFLAGLSLK
jgi:pimeloyl-ACP methyl ester carboxylesterase